jgi:ribosomal protein S12 methylthiotransferase accessory factor YcaO
MKRTALETIASLERALAADFRLVPLEAPDAPLFLAVALPVEDGVTGLKPRLPAGRGLTPQQAMIAAGAEALELRASLARSHLADLSRLARRDGLAVCMAEDLVTHQPVPVPAQEVYLDCAAMLHEPLRREATSTGCAAGADRDAALAAALWECVERDALALWWHGDLAARPLGLELIDALQPRLFWWLHQRERRTQLLDLTTDLGLPVVAAVASDPDGGTVAIGTAARPVVQEAALAAVTEMVQTEVGLDLACAAGDAEALDWCRRGSARRLPQVGSGDPALRPVPPPGPAELIRRLAGLGHRVLAVDLTLPADPLPSVRVMVQGLSAMGAAFDTSRFRRMCPDHAGPNLPEPY